MPYINWRLSDPDTVFNPVLDLRIGFNCKCKSVILIFGTSLVNGLPYLKKKITENWKEKHCGDICSERINIATTQKRSWCIIRNSSSLHNHLLSCDIRKSEDSPWYLYTWRTLQTLYYLNIDSRGDPSIVWSDSAFKTNGTYYWIVLSPLLFTFNTCTPDSFQWHSQK